MYKSSPASELYEESQEKIWRLIVGRRGDVFVNIAMGDDVLGASPWAPAAASDETVTL